MRNEVKVSFKAGIDATSVDIEQVGFIEPTKLSASTIAGKTPAISGVDKQPAAETILYTYDFSVDFPEAGQDEVLPSNDVKQTDIERAPDYSDSIQVLWVDNISDCITLEYEDLKKLIHAIIRGEAKMEYSDTNENDERTGTITVTYSWNGVLYAVLFAAHSELPHVKWVTDTSDACDDAGNHHTPAGSNGLYVNVVYGLTDEQITAMYDAAEAADDTGDINAYDIVSEYEAMLRHEVIRRISKCVGIEINEADIDPWDRGDTVFMKYISDNKVVRLLNGISKRMALKANEYYEYELPYSELIIHLDRKLAERAKRAAKKADCGSY